MSLINTLIDKISEYAMSKLDQIKLNAIGQAAKILAYVITLGFVSIIGLFFLFFGSFALGAYLNELLYSNYLGYLIVAGFYFLMLIIFFLLLRTGKIQRWLEILFLNAFESSDDHE